LFPLPGAERLGSRYGQISAANAKFGQSEGYVFRLRHPHVQTGPLYKLAAVAGALQVHLPQALQRIVEGAELSLNCDLEREPDAQPGE